MDIAPVVNSYYENFLELLAQILSRAVTTKEQEAILQGLKDFQEKLRRLSSQNLRRLQLEISEKEAQRPSFCKHEGKTCAQNCTRGFIRAFVMSFGIKYLVAILPALLTGKLFKKPGLLKQMAGNVFLSTYKGTLCTLRNIRKNDDPKSDRLNAFIAGSLAGLSLLIDPSKSRRQAIMLYLLTRSLQFNGAWLMKKWAAHRKMARREELLKMKDQLDLAGFQDGEKRQLVVHKKWDDKLAKFLETWAGVGVMMIASGQIIYAFLFESETLPKSYYQFLLVHSGWKQDVGPMAAPLTHAIGNTVNQLSKEKNIRMPNGWTSREYIAQHISPNIASIIPPKLKHNYIMCALQHPLDDSCTRSKATLFGNEFLRALKLYVPLNILSSWLAMSPLVFQHHVLFDLLWVGSDIGFTCSLD
ncbi:hypothetical protein BGW37DRAFT_511817 [Umbelopsis sp. PMI_123]|nr:hypothetical protein BGW37DRAFT_511817 [Umbelopsis sp. PMI_123]